MAKLPKLKIDILNSDVARELVDVLRDNYSKLSNVDKKRVENALGKVGLYIKKQENKK